MHQGKFREKSGNFILKILWVPCKNALLLYAGLTAVLLFLLVFTPVLLFPTFPTSLPLVLLFPISKVKTN